MASNPTPVALSDIVGRGWSYPFGFDARTGGVAKDPPVSDEQRRQRIINSIEQIIGVAMGSLFMSRTFGSETRDLVFKPNDISLYGLIQFTVTQAIETWEKRIRINNVDVEADPDEPARVQISLDYQIRRTNVQGNLVYPLYLSDAVRPAAEVGLQQ